MPKPKANVELIEGVSTAMPYLVPHVAESFRKLRQHVIEKSGHDFLSTLADAMRPANFISSKSGVAKRSWHLTGRAIDLDQASSLLVIVREDKGTKTFFRVYLKAKDGLGILTEKRDIRGFTVKDNLFDFTAAAESFGFQRIPAWDGWSTKGRGYNLQEWWHYQITDGLTWNQAMAETYAGVEVDPVLGVNDRGPRVKELQTRLLKLGWLAREDVDGVFGPKTKAAVIKFQTANSLTPDGLVGPATRKALNQG